MVREVTSTIIEKSVLVMDLLARSMETLSHSEIVSGTGLNKSSVHRVLAILVGQDLVQFNEHDKSYSIGPTVFSWARATWQKTDLWQIKDHDLVELGEATGMNVAVSVINDDMITFIRTRVVHPYKLSPKVGGQSDLHCTAAGKVFLAYMDPPSLDAYLQNAELEKYTENTFTEAEPLLEDIKTVIGRGYAISNREELWQVVGIAVPIVSYDNSVVAALGLWTPTKRASLKSLEKHATQLIKTASAISSRFGSFTSRGRSQLPG